MKIIGFTFKKIDVERKKELIGKLEINSNLQIEDIEKDQVDIIGDILKLSYSYLITYDPGFAVIEFKGTVLFVPNKPEEIKQIVKDWKKKKVPDEIKVPIFNFVISKCNLKALQLEEDFSLPPHIPLPKISPQKPQQTNYTG